MPNFRLVERLESNLSCSGLRLRGQPTEERASRLNPQDVRPGDVFTLEEWKSLSHKRDCPFHDGGTCTR
jgi:hypothetical protein